MLLVKLGGSVVTDKDKLRTARRPAIRRLAAELSAVLSLDDGAVSSMDLTPFLEFASMGFTPVTFGDVVRDVRRGFSICSGDLLMLELARAFRPDRAVFVADVDGLFTADPKRRRD